MNLKKVGIGLLGIIVIISVLFTFSFGFLVFSNIDNFGKTVKVYSLIKLQFFNEVANSDILEGAMKGMVDSVDDPYSSYMDSRTFEDVTDKIHGKYGGVGLLITLTEEKELLVVSPFKGSPSHRAGIVSGDIITEINDKNTKDMDLETAANLMQGEPDTDVILTVFREERGEEEYKITREIIEIPSVDGQIIAGYSDIGYINVSMFNENTGKELSDIINDLSKKGMKKIVLDLRNNPGGALVAAVETADLFIDSGPIVHIKSKYNLKTYEAKKGSTKYPMIVLVNEGSASASEILAGAIQDKKAGTLVGQTTFGKGVVQTLFPLEDGTAVKLTTAKYLTPNKRDIHEKGIDPDITVEMTNEETAYALLKAPDINDDKQLKKAIELLNK